MEDRLTNCHLYGYAGQLYRGVTEEGYVVLVDVPDDLECAPGDDVQVRLTNVDNVRSLRAEAVDFSPVPVDMKGVAENFLIHLTIGIVHEEIFCHSLHVHRHRREVHGFRRGESARCPH